MNIVDPVLFQCRISGDQPAICLPGIKNRVITYSEFKVLLDNVTNSVQMMEFRPGQIVGILIRDQILHILLIFALAKLGVATVSCRENSLPEELRAEAAIVDNPGPFANVS